MMYDVYHVHIYVVKINLCDYQQQTNAVNGKAIDLIQNNSVYFRNNHTLPMIDVSKSR